MPLKGDPERKRPVSADSDIRGIARAPPMTRHFARVSAGPLDVQSIDRACDLGHEIGTLACQDQRFDEQNEPVRSNYVVDHSVDVGLRRMRARCFTSPPSMRKFQRVSNLPASPSRWTLVQYGTGPMSALGQKRTCAAHGLMSALGQ